MRVQRVTAPDGGLESWTVVDETFAVVDPVDDFLAHLTVIERSPGTVRSYAFDLRDYFEFLFAHGIDWRTVRLEHLGSFVGWLRLSPETRAAVVTALVIDEPHCSAVTINRKLSAVGSFYTYHRRHGVECGELLTTIKSGGAAGSWRPFLAHLGSDGNKRRRIIKLKTPQRIPRTLSLEGLAAVVAACDRLRDRFLIELLAGTGMRIGEALGLRHEDIDAARSLIRIRRRINGNGARVKGADRDVPVSATLIRTTCSPSSPHSKSRRKQQIRMMPMRADDTEHLQKAAAARSERTRQRAIETLDRLQQDDAPVTVAGLARAAGVARSWIYTQPDLLARINSERPDTRPAATDRTRASDESWQRRIELAHQRIKQLSKENRQLRDQLAIAHGQRRADQITASKTPSMTQAPRS